VSVPRTSRKAFLADWGEAAGFVPEHELADRTTCSLFAAIHGSRVDSGFGNVLLTAFNARPGAPAAGAGGAEHLLVLRVTVVNSASSVMQCGASST
jgi:hypothetical protein